MRICLLIAICVLIIDKSVVAQKRTIDSLAYRRWTSISNGLLSDNARYLYYEVDSSNVRSAIKIVKSVRDKWNIRIEGEYGRFVNNDKNFMTVDYYNNQINLYVLGRNAHSSLKYSSYYISDEMYVNYLYYQPIDDTSNLFVRDLDNNREFIIKNIGKIKDFAVDIFNKKLLVFTSSNLVGDFLDIKVVDLEMKSWRNLNSSGPVVQYLVSDDNIYILSPNGLNLDSSSIFVLSKHDYSLKRVGANIAPLLSKYSVTLKGVVKDGKQILIELAEKGRRTELYNGNKKVDLQLWSYKDDILPPGRSSYIPESDNRLALINVSDGNIIQAGNVILNPIQNVNLYELENLKDSAEAESILRSSEVSADKKFAIYFKDDGYWSYEFSTGIRRNITEGVDNNWIGPEDGDADFFIEKGGTEGWLTGKNAVIVADEYDIWILSLKKEFAPINVTKGYGRRNKIKFYLLGGRSGAGFSVEYKSNDLIFVAFNRVNKENGFFAKKDFFSNETPKMLTMEDAMYWLPFTPVSFPNIQTSRFKPTKARKAKIFLVARSRSTESENFFITSDFKKFKQITNNNPERKFNWLTTQLVSWKTDSGRKLQGVLYKPENFDSTKCYPVILYYYRKPSFNLNTFMKPMECPGCTIDIPGYVSNGYLVFTPDIYFELGKTGESALEAITSAAKHLSGFRFVNPNKIGIQGCSFSGFTTNYIVTHSNIFAAACSASGLFDLISGYNSINGSGTIKQAQFEEGTYQMGGTIWDKMQCYIRNSPVLSADKLSTPFLMMHTTGDVSIPFSNAVEFFLAAKRLNKKVWLLQYGNKSNHTVYGEEGRDFNLRMRQFFDHYLKDAPVPNWMTVPNYSGAEINLE